MVQIIASVIVALAAAAQVQAAALGAPDICKPASKTDRANTYNYADETSLCQSNHHCDNACVSFVEPGPTGCSPDWDQTSHDDLKRAVFYQVAKDGQFHSTHEGRWTVAFYVFTSAFPNHDVAGEFGNGIDRLANGKIPHTAYFNSIITGQFYGISAAYGC
ncbi:hypothetical protein VHEMI08954 [[Torrubiella] hemipterigena]|uniref:Ecp2 effector protein domain-containing protein n=1 Tax=[Torrubiella] hemipterigena TaxID=1531966 RepID=A0A0A1TQM0_9HYPO|nr:hypothetical protein VHEMI08954 [[Torrubiella] hemipterigena]